MTGFEPLIGAATAGLMGLITKVVTDKGGDLLKRADIDLGRGQAVNRAVQKYVQRYSDRYGLLKLACVRMDSPMKLDEIYTAVQLLPRSALHYYESTESLEDLYRESGRRGFDFHNAERKQGIEVANEQQYLMLLGGPGVGKSTFLRKMGLEALHHHGTLAPGPNPGNRLQPPVPAYRHECTPVMLELRQFSSPDLSIKQVIAQEFQVCGFPKAEDLTELFLQQGKLLVLLDGLDEVPGEALNHAITEIENLVDRYDGNRFIASCRVAAYTFGGFRRFTDVAMAAFKDDQIEQFIRNWFQKPRDLETATAQRCWELLNSPDYRAAKELAQTPLLLTLLCVIYDEFQDFPKKRHQVYGEALDVVLRKWAAEKRLHQEPIYQKFGADLELELLSEIAYTSFVDDQLFFDRQTVLGQIQDFQTNNENAPEIDAAQILKEIEVQQGILVERSRDAYSFSHLTFQEYLTARCIVDNHKVDQVVKDHLTDERWREVFLLVAGLVSGKTGADRLLRAMEKQAASYLQSEKLCQFVAWADIATQDSPGDATPAAKRVAVFALALDLALALDRNLDLARARALALALALDRARALDLALDLDLDRALGLDRALAFDLDLDLAREYLRLGIFKPGTLEPLIQKLESLKSPEEYIQLHQDIWLTYIDLNLDLLDLSEVEISKIHEYFYSAELMIRCKEAAVRVSPQVWAGIESRILTVPTP